jgi:hypothetical protein
VHATGALVPPEQYDPAGHVEPLAVEEPAGQYEPAEHVHDKALAVPPVQ